MPLCMVILFCVDKVLHCAISYLWFVSVSYGANGEF